MPTNKVKVNTRTKQLTVQVLLRFNSDEKLFFFNVVLTIWNSLPLKNFTQGKFSYHIAKTKNKDQFLGSFKKILHIHMAKRCSRIIN